MQSQPVICNFPAVLVTPHQQHFCFAITVVKIFGFLVGIQDIPGSFSSLG